MFITGMGNLWGAGMSRAFATETHSKGWIIPTAMQFVPALMMLLLVPFTPESPRWLILKGQMQKAKTSLDRLRPKHDVDNGTTQAEVDALEFSIEESKARNQGSWMDLFRGNYLRRTWVSTKSSLVRRLYLPNSLIPPDVINISDKTLKTDLRHSVHRRTNQRQPICAIVRRDLLRPA
jgi:hypothetical protein